MNDAPIVTMPQKEIKIAPKMEQKLSRIELGKLRHQYITQVYHEVIACGHKFHPNDPPKHQNCPDCWEAFFRMHPGVVAAAQSIVSAFGFEQLVKCNGKKFCKYYSDYVVLREQEAENAKHDTITTPSVITG